VKFDCEKSYFKLLSETGETRLVNGCIPDRIFYPHFLPIFCLNPKNGWKTHAKVIPFTSLVKTMFNLEKLKFKGVGVADLSLFQGHFPPN
jgi:hypothetical protein